jgi:phosphoglycerate dehydrogenase-like enzyme
MIALAVTFVDTIFRDGAERPQLSVSNPGTLLGYPTAELTRGLPIALARNIPGESRSMLSGAWQTTLGIGLRAKPLSVLGLGRLGGEVAAIGKAVQMNVIGWSPWGSGLSPRASFFVRPTFYRSISFSETAAVGWSELRSSPS